MTIPVSGAFGSANLAAGTPSLLYTAPSGIVSTVEVSLCNFGTNTAKIRIAIGNGASPANTDWREYDWSLASGYPYSRTFIVGVGYKVWVQSDLTNVSAQCTGFEELA